MIQYGVAVLEKGLPFPADCALSWIIRVALNRQYHLEGVLGKRGHSGSTPVLPGELTGINKPEYPLISLFRCIMASY
jgi:hypothetical protein